MNAIIAPISFGVERNSERPALEVRQGLSDLEVDSAIPERMAKVKVLDEDMAKFDSGTVKLHTEKNGDRVETSKTKRVSIVEPEPSQKTNNRADRVSKEMLKKKKIISSTVEKGSNPLDQLDLLIAARKNEKQMKDFRYSDPIETSNDARHSTGMTESKWIHKEMNLGSERPERRISNGSEIKDANEHPLIMFFKYLNQDVYKPSDLESKSAIESTLPDPRSQQFAQEICKLMKDNPKLCTQRYPFKAFFAEQLQHCQKESIYPLHMLCALNAPLSCIKTCYSLYPIAMSEQDAVYGTPLHYACRFHSDVSVFQFLFKEMKSHHVDSFAISNRHHKRTPLHLACMNSNIPIKVFEFIVMKTPIEMQLLPDKYHMNLLHLACGASEPRYDVIHILLSVVYATELKVFTLRNDGVNVDGECCSCIAQDDEGSTPLHKAIRSKANPTVVKLLLFHSRAPLHLMDNNGRLPIHVAMQSFTNAVMPSDEVAILRMLISAYPHGLMVQDMQTKEIPQQVAKRLNLSHEIVRMLQPARTKRIPVEEICIDRNLASCVESL